MPKNDHLSLAVFDPAHLATRITALLDLLLTISAPMPWKIVPAVGIAPSMMITRGTVGAVQPSRATIDGTMNDKAIRTDVIEALGADSLRRNVAAVAQELAARLDHALSERRR